MTQGVKNTGPNGKEHKAVSPLEIASQARAYAPAMIRVLHGIANSSKAPPSARTAAANSLLDRGLGKPAQAIAIRGDPDSPVIFNLRLGDGMIDGGTVETIATEAVTAPLVAIATQDDDSPG